MSTKHVFTSSEGLVLKALKGVVALNPSLSLHPRSKSVYVASRSTNTRVAVIAGGGSGHEPAHAGYTGRGMLSASVCGDIFASPSASQILTTIRLAAGADDDRRLDVLVVINNYTGDRLNFGLAIERAKAEGINVDSVIVADDVSLLNSGSLVGPRGLAGNVLVIKILGALAEQGADLPLVKSVADALVANLASIGVGLEHCHVPGRSIDRNAALAENICEIGLGLHNEPGVNKYALASPRDLVNHMLDLVLTSRDGNFVERGNETVLFVNNLGGMSQLEMAAILSEVLDGLDAEAIHPLRIYLSAYMTSLNAPGFSVSLLNLNSIRNSLRDTKNLKTAPQVNILELLDTPTEATAWSGSHSSWPVNGYKPMKINASPQPLAAKNRSANESDSFWRTADISPDAVKRGILDICTSVLLIEAELTRCDTILGDGDCGETFTAGARALQRSIESGDLDIARSNPSQLAQRVGEIVEEAMGGSAGALFAIFLTALSRSIVGASSAGDIAKALSQALQNLSTHTPARQGDRTLVDALVPFCSALNEGGSMEQAVRAARQGAEATRKMKPRLGRATYVGIEPGGDLPPDPGALGVYAIVQGFFQGYNNTFQVVQ